MMHRQSTISETDIWAQLDALTPAAAEERPPNSVTISEFAIRRCCGTSSAARILNGLVAQGRMQRTRYRSSSGRYEYAYTMIQES